MNDTRLSILIALLAALGCGGDPGGPLDTAGSTADDSGDDAGGDTADTGNDDPVPEPTPLLVPLFDEHTVLEPALVEETPSALISRFADRARDRHAREDQFQAYEHYLPFYWEHRTIAVEVIDTIGRGGDTITFNVTTQWRLQDRQAELRFFYRGIGTVAEYHDNRPMTPIDALHYTHSVSFNPREGRPIEIGDRIELEVSQFLDGPPRGRTNYYGTAYLYIAGEGLVPWGGTGPRRDSLPLPVAARLGGYLTTHANESNEPAFAFSQMGTRTAPHNGPRFMIGRRLAHTDFSDGHHDESPENPVWQQQAAKLGPHYIDVSCNACHPGNGRALPPAVGAPLHGYVVKVGDQNGGADSRLGEVLQPAGEGAVALDAWVDHGALRAPRYSFAGPVPQRFSARIAPALVGLGLLEAIDEADVLALADPEDRDGDGISGRAHVVWDADGQVRRLGRFGWKAGQATVRNQTAGALRTDMGVLTSVYPTPECGVEQSSCGAAGAELGDEHLDDLSLYVELLGVPPQSNGEDAEVVRGKQLFEQVGCGDCHVSTFVTSRYAARAELRSQRIAPYTDLLLHDMGAGLADDLAEGDASGAEWRTAPLWGIGRTGGVSGGEAYLHDGRARTIDEAILWHGGEADSHRQRYLEMTAADRQRLLHFLQSL